MRQTKKLLLSLFAVTLVAACTDNGVFNPLSDASGTYTLTVYQGKSIPATFPTFVVTSGTLVLRNNGTFTESNNYTANSSGQTSQFVSQGTWTLNGTSLSLVAPAQNGDNPRNVNGTLDFDVNGVATVGYSEVDVNGVLQSYEYKR
jgi:hypothetical protein